jgi:DNA topoisomerase VI subunit B
MEIPEEILQAHKHLTRLLEKYLDDELTSKKKEKKTHKIAVCTHTYL